MFAINLSVAIYQRDKLESICVYEMVVADT